MSAILKQKLIDIANGFTKYGLWKGGGSSALSEMTDVTFTDLQTNDILKYNGSVWVNDDDLQKQIDTLNSNLESKMNGNVVVQGDHFVIIKIGKLCIMNGYFSIGMDAWTWIIQVDSSIAPIFDVSNGVNVQAHTNGVIQVTQNVNAGVAYSICWTTNS